MESLIGTVWTYKVNVALTFDPLTSKSIGSNYLPIQMHPTKFEGQQPKGCQVIDCKPYFTYKFNVTLTFDIMTPSQ
jgi:hypothetical protein